MEVVKTVAILLAGTAALITLYDKCIKGLVTTK